MTQNSDKFVAFKDNIFQDSSGSALSDDEFVVKVESLKKSCKSYTLEIVFGTIGLSVFLAVVFSGFIYKNRWNIRYLMRLTKI